MKNLFKKKVKKKGFTLIEVIVVLGVMAIISAIAIPSFSAVKNNSRIKADKESCETIKRISMSYVVDETIKEIPIEGYKITFGEKAENLSGIKDDKGGKELKDAFQEVKAPRTENATGYQVEISNNGLVEVKVMPDSLQISTK